MVKSRFRFRTIIAIFVKLHNSLETLPWFCYLGKLFVNSEMLDFY